LVAYTHLFPLTSAPHFSIESDVNESGYAAASFAISLIGPTNLGSKKRNESPRKEERVK
jgi:hypothetical protein